MNHPLTATLLALGTMLAIPPAVPGQARPPASPPANPASQAPSDEEAHPAFPGEVELVTVDVVVTDKQGNPVTGLTADDFTVEEEGVPQAISTFEAVELPPAPSGTPPARPPVSTNMLPRQRASRTFVIVFDDLNLTPRDAPQAKGAVAAFLRNGVREGDYASLLATSGESWWNTRMEAGREDLLAILRRLEGRRLPEERLDRLSDWEAMRIAEYNDTMVGEHVLRRFQTLRLTAEDTFPSNRVDQVRQLAEEDRLLYGRGINDLMVQSRATEIYNNVRIRATRTLATLERALASLAVAKGRKSLILVSDGFIMDNSLEGFRGVVREARRSNVAIYFVNTRGLQGLESAYGADLVQPIVSRDLGAVLADVTQEAAGAEHLAQDTGGFVIRNTNDLEGSIQRIARESLSYYLLGYDPSHTPHDGSYRRIQVKVRGDDLTIRARKGYYAPGGPARSRDRRADADMQRVLDSPYFTDEIPVRMTAYVREEALFGQARVLLAAEIGVSDLEFEKRDDGRRVGTLHLLLTVAPRDSSDVQREDKEVEIVLRPGGSVDTAPAWYTLSREFQLRKGWYQAKLVVRDPNDHKLGTVTHEFEVPDLGGWRVSTPVLSDALQRASADAPPTPLLVAHRRFVSGGPLYCQFDVYGATRGAFTGMPQVSAGYALVRADDGKTVLHAEPTAIRPTSLGYLSRLWAMGLAGVEPASYELLITVRDEISDREEVIREPLTVVAAPVASAGG